MRYKPLLQLILLIIVGANLTLVCQGHIHGGHFEGPHLAILPETDEVSAEQAGAMKGMAVSKSAVLLPGRLGSSTASAQNAPEGASTTILPAMLPATVQEHSTNTTISGEALRLFPTSLASTPDTPPPRSRAY